LFDEIDFKVKKLRESLEALVVNVKAREIPLRGLTAAVEKKLQYLCRACEIAEAVVVV
jgi:hypothetical protein